MPHAAQKQNCPCPKNSATCIFHYTIMQQLLPSEYSTMQVKTKISFCCQHLLFPRHPELQMNFLVISNPSYMLLRNTAKIRHLQNKIKQKPTQVGINSQFQDK